MSWVTVGVVGGSALLGAYSQSKQADATAKQNRANMMSQAAQTRYSPWTHAGVQNMPGQAVNQTAGIDGALGGAITGAQMAQQVKNLQKPQTDQQMIANYQGQQQLVSGPPEYGNTWSQMPTKQTFWGGNGNSIA